MTPSAIALGCGLLVAALAEPLVPDVLQELDAARRLLEEGHPSLALAKVRAASERAEKPIPWPASGQFEAMAARACIEKAKAIAPILVRSYPDPGPGGLAEARRLSLLAEEACERVRFRASRDGFLPEMGEASLDPLRIPEVRFLGAQASLLAGLALEREGSADKNAPLERAVSAFTAISEEVAGSPSAVWAAVFRARALLAASRPAESVEVLDAVQSLVAGPAATRETREALERTLARIRPSATHLRALAALARGDSREAGRMFAEGEAGLGEDSELLLLSGRIEQSGILAAEGREAEAEEALGSILDREDAWTEMGRALLSLHFPGRRTAREWREIAAKAAADGNADDARRAESEAARKAVEEPDGVILSEILRSRAEKFRAEGMAPEAAEAAWTAWRAHPDSPEGESTLRIALNATIPSPDPSAVMADPDDRRRAVGIAEAFLARYPAGDAVPEARLLIGLARKVEGDGEGALRALEAVPERSGARGEALLAVAEIRLGENPPRSKEALEAFLGIGRWAGARSKAETGRVRNLEALARLRGALLARSLGRDGEAVHLAEAALVSGVSAPADQARLRVVVAAGRAALGDADASAEAARALIREFPGSGEAAEAALSVVALLDRRLDDLSRKPGDPGARAADEGFREFFAEAASRLPPEGRYALHLRIGDRSLSLGHGDLALQSYRQALAALEREPEAMRAREESGLRYRIARACSAVGRHDEAVAILSALARQRPTSEAAWVREALAEALERKGDFREAARAWRDLSLGVESPRQAASPFSAAIRAARAALRVPDASFALKVIEDVLAKRGGPAALRRSDPAAPAAWAAVLAEIARASPGEAAAAEALRKSLAAP